MPNFHEMFGSESRQGTDKSKDRCKADLRESHLVCWGGEPKPELSGACSDTSSASAQRWRFAWQRSSVRWAAVMYDPGSPTRAELGLAQVRQQQEQAAEILRQALRRSQDSHFSRQACVYKALGAVMACSSNSISIRNKDSVDRRVYLRM